MGRLGALRRDARLLLDPRYLNAASTRRTARGFVRTLLVGDRAADELGDIFNHVVISERLHTAGQPTAAQLALVADAGFATVVNLAPHGAENAIRDEAGVVASLGMTYVHIPVAFDDPTEEDFARFVAAVDADPGERVFVHCAANMRVSAFVHRYRTQVLGEDPAVARADLERLWEPFGVWADFLER